MLLNLQGNRSSWSFTIPSGLIKLSDSRIEKLRVFCKKCVYRNDFPTVSPGKDQIKVNNNIVNIRHGSPDAILLGKELQSKTPGLRWDFDTYDGKYYLTNRATIPYVIDGYLMKSIIGITEPLTILPGEIKSATIPLDLSPPEVLNFKSNFLTSNMELTPEGVRASDILCIIGNNVVPYQTKLYTDNEGAYGHFLYRSNIDTVELSLEDNEGNRIATPNPIVMILAIEIWLDDEKQILSAVKEQLDLTKLQFLANDINKK